MAKLLGLLELSIMGRKKNFQNSSITKDEQLVMFYLKIIGEGD